MTRRCRDGEREQRDQARMILILIFGATIALLAVLLADVAYRFITDRPAVDEDD